MRPLALMAVSASAIIPSLYIKKGTNVLAADSFQRVLGGRIAKYVVCTCRSEITSSNERSMVKGVHQESDYSYKVKLLADDFEFQILAIGTSEAIRCRKKRTINYMR